jgi:hypothetical protein
MRMGREVFDERSVGTSKQFVRGFSQDPLIIAIRPRVIVGIIDRLIYLIVAPMSRRIGIGIDAMKIMRRADAAERADGTPQIEMVARDEQAAPAFAKRGYRRAIVPGKPFAHVDRE